MSVVPDLKMNYFHFFSCYNFFLVLYIFSGPQFNHEQSLAALIYCFKFKYMMCPSLFFLYYDLTFSHTRRRVKTGVIHNHKTVWKHIEELPLWQEAERLCMLKK